ncbi:MAG: LUD domain-containing protein [Chloroflexi bacterium]|nr:LUD domain-containing protein [Chloroflexota bacterium]
MQDQFSVIPQAQANPMNQFRQRIRKSIADEKLQTSLDANTERRLKVRAAALASIPDWETRRQRAHAIRADVIERLDDYLAQFASHLTANGVAVHWAKDAGEALRLVLEIVGDDKTGTHETTKLIAKSKSMVTEEIGLNHALEAAGHRVVETDLGEYIIQLRGERPSHIITPAVHLNRKQVGELFHEKLGIPYTEDIPTLTNTARAVLREVFLNADVGISGVNFGVVENGALTIVTNEGNGRMCTTLPRVHIALMGMERMAPTLEDLALFLSLLPRSATGQKLSVYTQLLRAPRPGQQRHVIIVDNGRARLRNSPLKESLYCIRCGACLNACPVFRELGGHAYVGADNSIAPYPGPIGSVISPGLLGDNYIQLAQASSLCGACKDACPVDIDLPRLLTRVRAGGASEKLSVSSDHASRSVFSNQPGKGLPFVLRLGLSAYSRVASSPRWFAFSQKLAAIGARIVSPFSSWMRFPAATGWGYSKDFPRPAARSFRQRFQARTPKSPDFGVTLRSLETPESAPQHYQLPITNIVPFGDYQSQFTAELTALGGTVVQCSQENLPEALSDFLRQRGATRVFVDEIGAQTLPAEFTAVCEPDPTIQFGLTGCAAGIANTGTIVLLDEGETLKASLLPEVHLVVLRARQLVGDLPEALAATRHARNAALVTGPSRTADIEMTLTIGVHGPKEIVVFLVHGTASTLVDDSKSG